MYKYICVHMCMYAEVCVQRVCIGLHMHTDVGVMCLCGEDVWIFKGVFKVGV